MLLNIPNDTYLYVLKNSAISLAFSTNYFIDNYKEIITKIDPLNIDKLLYKNMDKWINMENAVALKTGPLIQRMNDAFDDENFLIQNKDIPEAILTDDDGLKCKIPEGDGFYFKETKAYPKNFANLDDYSFIFSNNDIDLTITFDESIDLNNSILTINNYIFDFEIGETNNIALLKNVYTYFQPKKLFDGSKIYDVDINILQWKDLSISKSELEVTSVDGIGLYSLSDNLLFDKNYLCIYNGRILEFEKSIYSDQKIKIAGLNKNYLEYLDMSEIYFLEIASTTDEDVKLMKLTGTKDMFDGEVEFNYTVTHGILVYNGILHQYETNSEYRLILNTPPNGISEIDHEANIYLLNFFRPEVPVLLE